MWHGIATKLILNELLPRLKHKGLDIDQSPVSPTLIAQLATLKWCGLITTHQIRKELDRLI